MCECRVHRTRPAHLQAAQGREDSPGNGRLAKAKVERFDGNEIAAEKIALSSRSHDSRAVESRDSGIRAGRGIVSRFEANKHQAGRGA